MTFTDGKCHLNYTDTFKNYRMNEEKAFLLTLHAVIPSFVFTLVYLCNAPNLLMF